MEYEEFIRSKIVLAENENESMCNIVVNDMLFDHQKDIVKWAVHGGKRAIFASFGLGKTFMQLEILRIITQKEGGRGLIVAPLGVRQEFKRDAEKLGINIKFIRRITEAEETGIYITNYETIRDGKMDPRDFLAASLDEIYVLHLEYVKRARKDAIRDVAKRKGKA